MINNHDTPWMLRHLFLLFAFYSSYPHSSPSILSPNITLPCLAPARIPKSSHGHDAYHCDNGIRIVASKGKWDQSLGCLKKNITDGHRTATWSTYTENFINVLCSCCNVCIMYLNFDVKTWRCSTQGRCLWNDSAGGHEIGHHQLKNNIYSQLLIGVLALLRNLIISLFDAFFYHRHGTHTPTKQMTISPSPSVSILSADDTFTEAPW